MNNISQIYKMNALMLFYSNTAHKSVTSYSALLWGKQIKQKNRRCTNTTPVSCEIGGLYYERVANTNTCFKKVTFKS